MPTAPKKKPTTTTTRKKVVKEEVLPEVELNTSSEGDSCCSSKGECCSDKKKPCYVGMFLGVVIVSTIVSLGVLALGISYSPATVDKIVHKSIERFIDKDQKGQQQDQEKQQKEMNERVKSVKPLGEGDYIRGNKDATVSIIEYSDLECPFCKRNHPTILSILQEYPNDVNWAFRHYPLPFHEPNSSDESEAMECVGSIGGAEKVFKFVDTLFERTPANKGFKYEQIAPLAEEIGVDKTKFDDCMKAHTFKSKVSEQMNDGNALGISGTPANIIRNNKTGEVKVLSGAYPKESFKEIIDAMLKK